MKQRSISTVKLALAGFIGLLALFTLMHGIITYLVADYYNFHVSLGKPQIGSVYFPFDWIKWRLRYTFDVPDVLVKAQLSAMIVSVVLLLGYALFLGFVVRRMKFHKGLHGTSAWATQADIEAAGLIAKGKQKNAGVYLGAFTCKQRGVTKYLRDNSAEHVAAIAPTRSGKGVGLVIPTLLSWPHSCVVNDQKAELWHITAGWRSQEVGPVYYFNPSAEEGSIGINPLSEIRLGTASEIKDTQNLVSIIVDPDGKGLSDHWDRTAFAFMAGLVLHVLYEQKARGKQASLSDIKRAFSHPNRPIDELYEDMLTNRWGKEGSQHYYIASAAQGMLNKPEEERGSVLSSAESYLSLFDDPIIEKNTSHSTIPISDIMNAAKPVTLYLVTREEDKDRLKPLVRIILTQMLRVLLRPELRYDENNQPIMPHKHKLLLMLDEFPSYGKMDILKESLSYIAGYGIKAFLIMQDIKQMLEIYKRDSSILSNCPTKVAYAPSEVETAEWLSKHTGEMTVIKEEFSTSGKRFASFLEQVTRNFREVRRPLATPDEILRMKKAKKNAAGTKIVEPGESLVFVSGCHPIKAKQSLYFLDKTFLARASLPAPTLISDRSGENQTVNKRFSL